MLIIILGYLPCRLSLRCETSRRGKQRRLGSHDLNMNVRSQHHKGQCQQMLHIDKTHVIDLLLGGLLREDQLYKVSLS